MALLVKTNVLVYNKNQYDTALQRRRHTLVPYTTSVSPPPSCPAPTHVTTLAEFGFRSATVFLRRQNIILRTKTRPRTPRDVFACFSWQRNK